VEKRRASSLTAPQPERWVERLVDLLPAEHSGGFPPGMFYASAEAALRLGDGRAKLFGPGVEADLWRAAEGWIVGENATPRPHMTPEGQDP
jgi:hypothetical protein